MLNTHSFKILKWKSDSSGTELIIKLPDKKTAESIVSKKIRTGTLCFNDGRQILQEQRKKIYATVRDISQFTGERKEVQKELLKYLHIERTDSDYFSLSDCSMDTAREFINTILDFALEHGVQLEESGLDRTDDINNYLYSCLRRRKCALCGRDGETHHWDAIGMGNNRVELDDSNHRKICLCRQHHSEAHTIGREVFGRKYKVYGIKV